MAGRIVYYDAVRSNIVRDYQEMKRKLDIDDANGDTVSRKAPKSDIVAHSDLAPTLFDPPTVARYHESYSTSEPYKHAVVQPLVPDELLRSVRQEIIDNIHFTTKETDIYRIFQSGDLANLHGLPAASLTRLPSLLRLRDALYSAPFRSWISAVSGAGALSGTKTDMAINVYKPGCHLLCHDDVIGSRRVSYILYLTDPDLPWKPEWGGALRLYPTKSQVTSDGRTVKVPEPTWSKIIPPAWNQLSFFAVQPGESFHDVEEVYHRPEGIKEDDGGRIRMAISGWFHIPQRGEDGFEEGLEERLAERSSLQQLQAKDDSLDRPETIPYVPRPLEDLETANEMKSQDETDDDDDLSQADLDFLLRYMSPQYLTPDTVEELNELFSDESSLQLANLLSPKLLVKLESELLTMENVETANTAAGSEQWHEASPPHKHHFLYQQCLPADKSSNTAGQGDVLGDLLNTFLPSVSFHKWLALVTGLSVHHSSLVARRFRKGLDYTLATSHDEDNMQLEWSLNLTPSKGWIAGDDGEDAAEVTQDGTESNGHNNAGKSKAPVVEDEEKTATAGGYELYMAGDDVDADDDHEENDEHGVTLPSNAGQATSSTTGGGHRRILKSRVADPAIYKASNDEEDDGILFTNPASWNTMSIVLRDQGTLKFVKYVSKNAPGDRWDIVGSAIVLDDSDEEDAGGEGADDSEGDGPEDDDGGD